jgi:hypothetical protein
MRDTTLSSTRRLISALAALFLSLAAVGCSGGDGNDDSDDPVADAGADVQTDTTADTGTDTNPDADEMATGGLSLSLFDIDGSAVEGASVTIGETSEQTDASGAVKFEELPTGRTVAQIEADGYAPRTAVVEVREDATVYRPVHLLESGEPHEFDASTDTDLYEDRVHLALPGASLVDENGDPYTGSARAHITPLNPSTDERDATPGPLMGVLEGDEEPTPMESVLMADIRLETDAGAPLSLKEGESAELEYVLPDDLQNQYSEGDEIEAYWYDNEAGHWIQEGRGTVTESSYAADKLAWIVDVSHFTWWNCDAPISDRNCAQVEVVEQGSSTPVVGADVYVDGVSYNGTSSGTTDSTGLTCVDYKKGSTAEVTAVGPNGERQVGGGKQISGSSTAASCSGGGSGSCKQVQVQVAPPTCLSGQVVDGDGNPLQDVQVRGIYQGSHGQESATATTDSSGSYCLSVPQQASVEVVASHNDNGTYKRASTQVTAGSSANSCGGGSCGSVGDLTPTEPPTGCLEGSLSVESSNGVSPAAAGTHVYAFEGNVHGEGDQRVDVDCSESPGDWGPMVGQTTTDANGEFCVSVPSTASDLSIVAGKCGSADRECLRARRVMTSVGQGPQCGSGNCAEMEETVFMRQCGEGP